MIEPANSSPFLNGFVFVIVMGLAGCATPETGVQGEPPPREEVDARQTTNRISLAKPSEREREKTEPEPVLTVAAWPFQEANTDFVLTWQGGENATVLYEEPSLNARKIGELFWKNGEEVITRNSVVAVFEPSVYRARDKVRVEGYVYDPESYRTDGAQVSYDIDPGETIEVFHYKESGICYMRVRSQLIEGNCPSDDRWDGNFRGNIPAERLGPVARIWWIQITTPDVSGWIQVDDRFAVDIESI